MVNLLGPRRESKSKPALRAIGGHTDSRTTLKTLEAFGAAGQMADICTIWRPSSGGPVRHLAYPYGGFGVGRARNISPERKDYASRSQLSTDKLRDGHIDRYTLPRIGVANSMLAYHFRLRCAYHFGLR